MDFWLGLETLVRGGKIVIDRPKGSVHPRYPSIVYPLDYGFVEDTTGGDGQAVDVWRGSLDRSPLVGIVCTVDRLKRDAEVKLLLGCTPEEVDTILSFHNDSGMMSAIAVWRDEAER